MELLEGQDPEKKRLIETSDRHKHELEKEVKALSDKTEKIAKNALIIGGSLAVAYLVFTSINSSKKKKKKAKVVKSASADVDEAEYSDASPSILSQIGERFAAEITAFLLGLAKEKLLEYMSNRQQQDENS